MSEATRDRLLNHNYDGIQEYDNPMPRWWVWLFWVTIIFSEIYFIYYHLGPGPTIHDEYAAEIGDWDARLVDLAPAVLGEADLRAIFADPARVATGNEVFQAKCMACHQPDGGGVLGLGPNLTDNYWKTGDGSLGSIYATVRDGVAGTAMQAWDQLLKPQELQDVVAFTYSLKGTVPANPKEPEGQLIE
jgi:cytochrome c oxidase cbb3-type subunit III